MSKTSRKDRLASYSDRLSKRALQIQRGAARAAVLGVNDGLVSVLCVVLAVAAAGEHSHTILLAGIAALIAGAISMSAGEWISLKSQVDLYRGVLVDVNDLLREERQLLVKQLEEHFIEDGQEAAVARKAAQRIGREDETLIREYAINVMGFNPEELGSPWTAALSSFALFTVGGLAPLVPWFFSEGGEAITASIALTLIGGTIVGGYVGSSSGSSVPRGAVRQLFIIIFASAVTYGVGHLFGVAVG